MRKVFYAPWPHDDDVLEEARNLGCSEVLDGEGGYTEIAEPLDDLDTAKAYALDQLSAERYARSQSMAYTPNGETVAIPLDTSAATNVISAIVGLQLASSTGPITWKFGADHFVSMHLADLITMGQAMRAHVQACYDNEATLAAAINAAPTAEAALAVNLQTGWPG